MFNFASLNKLRDELVESISSNDLKRLCKLLNDKSNDSEINNSNENIDQPFINVNFIDCEGQTLMHRACRLGNLEIVKLLAKHGASQNIKSKNEWFPIHVATYYGHFDVVKYLINENNFKHQSLIAVYDDEVEQVKITSTFNSSNNMKHVDVRKYEADKNVDKSSNSETDTSSIYDEDYYNCSDEYDYSVEKSSLSNNNHSENSNSNGTSLDDLINNLDLNPLEFNTINEGILDELLDSSQYFVDLNDIISDC